MLDLTSFVRDNQPGAGFRREEGILFFAGLKKLAAQAVVDTEPAQVDEAAQAAPEDQPQSALPVSGTVTPGSFVARPPEVANTLRLLAAAEFHANALYTVYGASVTGPHREAIEEVFLEIAESELEDARWVLQKLVVIDGAVGDLGPIPPPPPADTPEQMLQNAMQVEQRAISLLQTLRLQVGEHPMKYTIEQMIGEEQEHYDRLRQMAEESEAATPTETQKAAARVAQAFSKFANAVPGPAEYIAQQRQLGLAQAENEAAFLRDRVEATQSEAANHAAEAQTAQATADMANQQLTSMQQTTQQLQQQLSETQQNVELASQQAATAADQKMRLTMRIQQMRQQLADIVSQDPTVEEGTMPEPGVEQPMTSAQQGQAAEAEAAQAAAGQEGAPPKKGDASKAEEQTAEADRAQADAAKQTAQAEQAQSKLSSASIDAILGKYKMASDAACGPKAVGAALAPRHAGRAKSAGITVPIPEAMLTGRISAMADRAHGMMIDPKRIAALKQHHTNFVPKAIPEWKPPTAAPSAVPHAAPAVKRTPTQAVQPLALSKHLAQTNPKAAVVAGQQHGLPVTANAATLAELERMNHFKGAALVAMIKKANAIQGPAGEPQRAPKAAVANLASAAERAAPATKPGFLAKKVRELATVAGEGAAAGASSQAKSEVKGVVSKLKGMGRGAALLGGAGLGAVALHKGLKHVEETRAGRRQQQQLDQRERILRVLEQRQHAA